jgi:hypothetical protein
MVTMQRKAHDENGVVVATKHEGPRLATLQRLELGDDDGWEAAEFCVGGDELGVVGASGGVEEGVGHGEAVIEAGVGGGESGHFVERDDAAVESLRQEAIGERLATVAGELAVDLVDDERGNNDGSLVLQVMGEQWGFGVFGEIFEPA